MKKRFMPLTLAFLLVCFLLCSSAFAANGGSQTEPAVIEVDTAALFSVIESSDVQMVNALETQGGADVVAPDTAQSSRIGDVAVQKHIAGKWGCRTDVSVDFDVSYILYCALWKTGKMK